MAIANQSRMLYRTKHFLKPFDLQMRQRKDVVLAERIKGYEDARRAQQEKDEHNAAELAKMREEARSWTHRPLTHRSARITNSAHAARWAPTPTITSLVEQTKERTRGTQNQKNEAARKMLVRWLTVFHRVYALSAVASLHDIFFSAKTQKLCIVSDASTGTAKTVTRLMSEVARCSDYIESAGLTVSASAEGDSDC
jgi:hypothetical protein